MTPARRAGVARYQARRRAEWRAAGLCVGCGADRKWPWLSCGLCIVSGRIRWDRSQFKASTAAGQRQV